MIERYELIWKGCLIFFMKLYWLGLNFVYLMKYKNLYNKLYVGVIYFKNMNM